MKSRRNSIPESGLPSPHASKPQCLFQQPGGDPVRRTTPNNIFLFAPKYKQINHGGCKTLWYGLPACTSKMTNVINRTADRLSSFPRSVSSQTWCLWAVRTQPTGRNFLKRSAARLTALGKMPVPQFCKIFLLALSILLTCAFSHLHAQPTDTSIQQTIPLPDTTDTISLQNLLKADTASKAKNEAPAQKEEEKITPTSIFNAISFGKIFWSIVLGVAGYYIIRLLTQLLGRIAERSAQYRITLKGLVPAVRIIGWLLVLFIIIWGVIDPPLEQVIAVTASVGIAVGFASQDILKNIFGGVIILLDTPFQVGDKIEVGSYYGEVVEIGLRSTRIVTPDDSLVTIPNGELMNTSVSNSNAGEPNCLVVAEIYLPMDIDTEKVRQIATEAACVSKYIYLNKPIAVLFGHEVKDRRAYLKMRLKAYVMDIRYEFAFKSDLTEIVLRELMERKIILEEDYS